MDLSPPVIHELYTSFTVGDRYRARQCNAPMPADGGNSCERSGQYIQTKKCVTKVCVSILISF